MQQPQPVTSSTPDVDWLTNQLRELEQEQQRRAYLTTEEAEIEHRFRQPQMTDEPHVPAPDMADPTASELNS